MREIAPATQAPLAFVRRHHDPLAMQDSITMSIINVCAIKREMMRNYDGFPPC